MPVNTVSAALHITPVVVKTIYEHEKRERRKRRAGDERREPEATDDVFYDEAFHVVKAFIELGTHNTIESLQEFTNTHVPAPYWAAVSPVQIPFKSCNRAADVLIDWFGPEELASVVGGERWWQVRGLNGIDGEWVTEKRYLSDMKASDGNNVNNNILGMEHLETVMLYIHGGAYAWGSINTHRYQIIRYARKMKGRAFAVNYRKAPQYPWPCALQDVLAAYFYLTSPPPAALHKAVPHSKIVFAGDSAGGALCLTVLTVLRDMGLPQPAGAVLISPWVDLTHSFPSIMNNVNTDIIPPHGFIHRPSVLWPVKPLPEGGRVIPTTTNPPPMPGHADTLRPSGHATHFEKRQEEHVGSQADMLKNNMREDGDGQTEETYQSRSGPPTTEYVRAPDVLLDQYEPKPPKVLMKNSDEQPLEVRSQIQLYAMTEQLSHPLVSPVVQGSLGGLCPLYIIAGDDEALRDEIIYIAHKAANPADFPTRQGAVKTGRRQQENATKFQIPTKVHLQVFDGMCHALTVFTFTESAKYAYRSIARFVRHVTDCSEDPVKRCPFPELHQSPSYVSDSDSDDDRQSHQRRHHGQSGASDSFQASRFRHRPFPGIDSQNGKSDKVLYQENEKKAKEELKAGEVEMYPHAQATPKTAGNSSCAGSCMDGVPEVTMIRERVDIYGRIRPMEPKEEIQALRIPAREIGLIKEEPVKRWLAGQEVWDRKYRHTAHRVLHRRHHYANEAARLIKRARQQGLMLQRESACRASRSDSVSSGTPSTSIGYVESERRWGPFDLDGEHPPPSAIAGRRDNHESIALIKKTIYHSAPVTHKTIARMSTFDALRAALNPREHPVKPPKQSVAEEQTHTHILPFHGVRMWQSLLTVFMRTTSQKAVLGKKHAASALRITKKKAGFQEHDDSESRTA